MRGYDRGTMDLRVMGAILLIMTIILSIPPLRLEVAYRFAIISNDIGSSSGAAATPLPAEVIAHQTSVEHFLMGDSSLWTMGFILLLATLVSLYYLWSRSSLPLRLRRSATLDVENYPDYNWDRPYIRFEEGKVKVHNGYSGFRMRRSAGGGVREHMTLPEAFIISAFLVSSTALLYSGSYPALEFLQRGAWGLILLTVLVGSAVAILWVALRSLHRRYILGIWS